METTSVLGANRIEIETGGYVWFDVQLTNSPHKHDYYEICLVLSGAGVYHHGGKSYPLKKNDVFVADPGVTHEITSYETKDLHLYFVTLTLTRLNEATEGPADQLIQGFQKEHAIVKQAPETIENYVDLIEKQRQGFRAYAAREALKLFALEMLAVLAPTETKEEQTQPDEILQAIDYIGRHIQRRITVDEIAREIGVSSRTLRRKFKEQSQTTVAQEINHRRMRWAAHQLLMGFSVAEVSEIVGITDPAQFTRAFTRAHGMTPKKFQTSYMPGHLAFKTRP